MSYSYTDILLAIQTARADNDIHAALGHYATLSEKCSMTPLLWIQYAQDSKSVDSTLSLAKEVIELALEEFPGCVLLWVYYLDVSFCTNDSSEETWAVWTNAMKNIKGLQTPPQIILEFYRLGTRFFPGKTEEIFVQRAYDILDGNESIVSEMQSIAQTGRQISNHTYSAVEEGRRFASQNLGILKRFEEDVSLAMLSEQIYAPTSFSFQDFLMNNHGEADSSKTVLVYDWDSVIASLGGINGQVLMGNGMMQTASSFLSYVQGLFQHIKYLKRKSKRKDEDNKEEEDAKSDLIELFSSLIIPVYERAVSECPTVEIVWEKYLKHLTYVFYDDELSPTPSERAAVLIQLQNVASRAVKNCPYSLKLFTMKMQTVLDRVEAGRNLLEPDDLMKIVDEAVNGKFLPDAISHLQVYLSACRLVKRRILNLVSKATSSMAYDESERLDKASMKKRKRGEDVELKQFMAPLEEDVEQEVQDLIEDLRDIYDAADSFLRKTFSGWTEGRSILYREKAKVEAYVCSPLMNEDNNDGVIKCFEKMVRVHQPPHPNLWRDYIQYMMGKSFVKKVGEDETNANDEKMTELPGMIAAKLRFVRNMYQRAFTSIKKPNGEKTVESDVEYESALRLLCEEFTNFETSFGSDKSAIAASKIVSKKLASLEDSGSTTDTPAANAATVTNNGNDSFQVSGDLKRKRDHDSTTGENTETSSDHPELKKIRNDKMNENNNASMEEDEKQVSKSDAPTSICDPKSNTKKKGPNIWPVKPKPEHFVTVGKMKYPAHPFTVHVSNLSSETMDMDLYDLFHSKCGAIVHVRIFREKQKGRGHDHIPKSKCAGLIQFEERESVEKALKLSGEVGLNEKLIAVSRSHQPAVGIVPPGMHRIQPKGQGKHTKRNVKRKERRIDANSDSTATGTGAATDVGAGGKSDDKMGQEEKSASSGTSYGSILAFRPRSVGQKQRKKKVGL